MAAYRAPSSYAWSFYLPKLLVAGAMWLSLYLGYAFFPYLRFDF
eukprot:COSAG05_NODE_4699_length_1406_cov_1.070390_2_plen_43_part_01